MAKHIPKLDSKSFRNWLKLGICVDYTRSVIKDVVSEDTEQFQQEILKEVYTQKGVRKGTTCTRCFTGNLLPCPTRNLCDKRKDSTCSVHTGPGNQRRACPDGICDAFVTKIRTEHFYRAPSWKNANVEQWCTHPVEIAKCFMPREGYVDIASFENVDFNGFISVVINNKRLRVKLTDDKVATEAREVGKHFRHCPELSMVDADFEHGIEVLVALLSDSKHLLHQKKSKEAVAMLKQLKKQGLSVSSTDAVKVIESVLSGATDESTTEGDHQRSKINKPFLLELCNALKRVDHLTEEKLAEIISATDRAVSKIKCEGKKIIRGIKREGAKQREESKRMRMCLRASTSPLQSTSTKRISESEDYPKLKHELQMNLIDLYRKQHINLPVSPLRPENEAPLLEFYVTPSLRCKEYTKRPYVQQDSEQTTAISSYYHVFFKGDTECQDIYIASPAGMGKTSYLKRMTLAWCYSHSPEEKYHHYFTTKVKTTLKDKYIKTDSETMEYFDFLFFLSLRETGKQECDIDEMIKSQVIRQLSLSYRYSDHFIQEVLHSEKCLILLDGLDEWNHTDKPCKSPTSVVPHRKVRNRCTIVTSTRAWKLDAVIESNDIVDQHIEMHGLGDESATSLIDNALRHLNDKYRCSKSTDEFSKLLKENRVHKLKSIPLLLLQMLCLWFAEGRLGKSRCEIYSNILEFLFKHTKETRRRPETRSKTQQKIRKKHPSSANLVILPTCLSGCRECDKHKHLLLSLGHMAFDGLFGICPESFLIFTQTVVQKYLNRKMLDLCKETGLLSQNNAHRKLTAVESNFSFIHKSYQEFLAALYISLKWSPDILKQMLSFCSTTKKILQVSNVFIFVNGMNPEVSEALANSTSEIVSRDEGTTWFRKNIGTIFIKSRMTMHRLHTMMMNCVQESYDNGVESVNTIAEDIVINNKCKFDWFMENNLMDRNVNNIRSLDIQVDGIEEQVHELLESVNVHSLQNLTKLFIWGELHAEDITTVIHTSSKSLTCIELWDLTFTDGLIDALKNVQQLEGLSLLSVTLSHMEIETLMEFLGGTRTLLQLSLYKIKCSDHVTQPCTGYTLNISQNSNLYMLVLIKVHLTKIYIDTQQLVMCVVEWLDNDGTLASLLDTLKHAPKLERFECTGSETPGDLDKLIKVFPTFRALRYARLRCIKLKERFLDFGNCDSLECVYMWRVEISDRTLKQLLDKITKLERTVTVMLEGCKTRPDKAYVNMKQRVKESNDFEVIRDTNNSKKYDEFYFRTFKH